MNMLNSTILVTGGAGYIGSHFVNFLIQHTDAKIVVVDSLRETKNFHNKISNQKVVYYETDIADAQSLDKIFTDHSVNAVVHYAALANVPDSVSHPEEYYRNNVVGGLVLLNTMLKHGVKNIIFSSSASVYGEPISEIISEDHPKIPTNPYGYTKLVFEHILQDYNKAYGLNSISFRYFCASGSDESMAVGEYHMPETHVIPCIFETILGKREKFYVYGNDYPTPDGTGVRDYIHVNDLASAHLKGLIKLLQENNVCSQYNLGINKGFSVMELIKNAERLSGKKVNYEIMPRRAGDPSRLIADSSKVQMELNWQPQYLLIEQIMQTAFDFYKKNI
jgi:UDP-glucose 4-epimerase